MIIIDHSKVPEYAQTLIDNTRRIPDRVNSLFCLRTVASIDAIDALIKAFYNEPTSDLLRHEICYCLGQMDKSPEHIAKIQAFFDKILLEDYPQIVLHEAVEALGNLNQDNTFKLLERFNQERDGILYETCFLTKKLIEWKKETDNGKSEGLNLSKLRCSTNDPAPPFNYKRRPEYASIPYLQQILLDNEKYDLFERYRALFTLREINTEEAAIAICQCMTLENSKTCSDLLKHEVAFVLAQMEDVFMPAVPYLLECVRNPAEAPIVRHEVLICLGEMIKDKTLLEPFLSNEDLIVSQSAESAINLIEYRARCAEQEALGGAGVSKE
ncbi:hypothetical protein FGO68_gene13979 [Halteria grandinella]|uniref:Deoxyhypusine hydroxylase n=1 Tax=Halteria grandinella TaxID=5974 RepID=A0A8J8NK70_HALGN|nr:hypothetical protein FGO68_gene13979 [Halteria grandinella]